MEHLWSYLKQFGRMTKEIHPSNSTDVLCHGSISKKKLVNIHYRAIMLCCMNDYNK